jgi:hypothetical protein
MRRLLLIIVLLLVPSAILAQSLGQAAAQERERREKKAREGKPAAGRVFTNDDLKGSERPASKKGNTASSSHSEGVAPARGDGSDTAPKGTREGGSEESSENAGWRARAVGVLAAVDQARAREGDIQSRIDQLQQEMNPMSPTYVLDPNRFLRIQDEIRNAQAELAGARQQTRAAQEAWDQLAEEARRAGVSLTGSPR